VPQQGPGFIVRLRPECRPPPRRTSKAVSSARSSSNRRPSFSIAEARAQKLVLCLAIDPGRAVEIATRRPAIVVTVGPIEWVKADEAWVTVTQTWSASKSLRRPYRVVREPDGAWTSLGPILKGAPA
jgi:hypothetical protein